MNESRFVISAKLHRARSGRSRRFSTTPPATPEPVRRPARVAIMLALAHKIQDAIDRRVVADRAEAARRLGVTRARVTQLLDLALGLAPQLSSQLPPIVTIRSRGSRREIGGHSRQQVLGSRRGARRASTSAVGRCRVTRDRIRR